MTRQEAIEKVAGVLSQWMAADWYKEAAIIVDVLHPELKPKYRVYKSEYKFSVVCDRGTHLEVWFSSNGCYTESEAHELVQRECDRLNEGVAPSLC